MSSARHNSDWQSIAQLSANQPFVLLIKNAHIVLPWETSNERKLPAMNYLFWVNNVNTKTTCENCSRLTIETLELRQNSSWLFYIIFQYYKNIVKIFAKIWLYTCYIEMLIECIQNPLGNTVIWDGYWPFFAAIMVGWGEEKWILRHHPANICLYQVNSRNTRKMCEICLTFIVNFEHNSHLFLVFLLLNLNK